MVIRYNFVTRNDKKNVNEKNRNNDPVKIRNNNYEKLVNNRVVKCLESLIADMNFYYCSYHFNGSLRPLLDVDSRHACLTLVEYKKDHEKKSHKYREFQLLNINNYIV